MQTPQHSPETRLITSEAVILDIYPAEFASRALARLIDTLLVGMIQLILFIAILMSLTALESPEWVMITMVVIITFAVNYGYHIFFNARDGRTPGKAVLGLQILNRDGGPATIRQYAAREFVGIAELQALIGIPALLSSIYSPLGQRLGDLAANTVVVHTRPGPIYGTSRAMYWPVPHGMEWFLPGMDLTGLTGEDITTIRTFLIRAPKMRPDARANQAARLRALVYDRCAIYLPADVPDEVVLATVMAKLTSPATLNRNVHAAPRA